MFAILNSPSVMNLTPRKKQVSVRDSLRVMHIIRSETLGGTLGENLGSDYMHDSRRDSPRFVFFRGT